MNTYTILKIRENKLRNGITECDNDEKMTPILVQKAHHKPQYYRTSVLKTVNRRKILHSCGFSRLLAWPKITHLNKADTKNTLHV